jgi:DNA-binding MarR family transcriptional regulator
MKNRHKSPNVEPGVMDCFILALIGKMNLTSLYAFRQEAELEPGGIRSALKHLEERDLITRAEPGTRMRRDMALTEAGRTFLDDSWKMCLREYADSESVLRAAWVASVMSDLGQAAIYLQRMGEKRHMEASETRKKAEHLERKNKTSSLFDYRWMRTWTEADQRGAESEAFLLISRSVWERSRKDVQLPLSASTS